MGSLTLPPLSLRTVVTQWQFGPVVTALMVAAAVAYLWGVRRVAARHPARPWPAWRTGMFLTGLAVIVVATESGVGVYDDALFWDHMVQHLLLIGVAPPLLVAGQPVVLLLHASRNPLHTWVKRAVRSRVVTFLTWPVFGLVAYAATIAGTHLTSFMNLVLVNNTVHEAEHALYVVVGYLYFLPLVGREPIRWRLSYPIRLLVLFLAMPVDAFTGVALMSYTHNPFPQLAVLHRVSGVGPAPLDDVHTGGAVMWVGGAGIMFILIMIVFFQWARQRPTVSLGGWLEAARRENLAQLTGVDATWQTPQENERAADAASVPSADASTDRRGRPRAVRVDVDEDEQQLAAYNAFLARLNAAEQSAGGRPRGGGPLPGSVASDPEAPPECGGGDGTRRR